MKKKNCECEFKKQRKKLLLLNFRESLKRQSQISAAKAFGDAISAPAPRFWVSEARATVIVRRLLAGEDATAGMLPEKARMFREIYRRVCKLMKEEPDSSLGDLVFRVVNSEAPSFFMSVEHARKLIREQKKEVHNHYAPQSSKHPRITSQILDGPNPNFNY